MKIFFFNDCGIFAAPNSINFKVVRNFGPIQHPWKAFSRQNCKKRTYLFHEKKSLTFYSKTVSWITSKQLEAIRLLFRRAFKRYNDHAIWIYPKPNFTITKKPIGIRMGKGRGLTKSIVAIIDKTRPICSVEGPFLKEYSKGLHYKIATSLCIKNIKIDDCFIYNL